LGAKSEPCNGNSAKHGQLNGIRPARADGRGWIEEAPEAEGDEKYDEKDEIEHKQHGRYNA